MFDNRGQQEIVGFVIIIVIVAVIGLLFLSFMIGTGETVQSSSAEISNFLQASMYHTTDCALDYIPNYQNVEDLIRECYQNPSKTCFDGSNVCSVVDSTLKSLIEKSFVIQEDGVNKAYTLEVYYKERDSVENITFIESGVFEGCKSEVGGSYSIVSGFFSTGVINVELEVCKN